jgi:myosin heavy subunit
MSVEEIIEEYSKKWGVPREEAERKIKKMLEEKTPSAEKIFPEPIGEISKKIQDINQAALSTAYTRRLLSSPPEDVAALRDKIEKIDAVVADLKAGIETKINQLTEILNEKTRKEQREELLKELDSKMDPLRQTLQTMVEKLKEFEKGETLSTGEKGKPSEILKQADQLAEEAKSWLSKLGYKVEPEKLSRDEVQKMIQEAQKHALASLSEEDLKKRLQEAGYKIVGGPLTYEQVEKLVEEAKRKAQEEAIDDKRIDAVADIIRESVTKIIEMFKPAVETFLQSTPQQASGGSETRSMLKEASK